MKCSLIAKIQSKGNLKGKLNNPTVYVYPEADKLDITPSEEIQKYEGYYNEINVSAIPTEERTIEVDFSDSENMEVVPSADKYLKKVTVNKDENLIPDNIRKDVTISGIQGTMEGAWDSTQIRRCSNMFYGNTEMTEAPYFDTSNVMYMNSMFSGCTNLTKVPKYNTSKVISVNGMFDGCSALTEVPYFDTSNVTDIFGMFNGCSKLINVPAYNTHKVTSMNAMFDGCSSLVSFPVIDTSNVMYMNFMCRACSKLENFPVLNTSNVQVLNNTFAGCNALTDESLNNILQMCIGATKIASSNKNLKYLGISAAQAERCQTLSNYQTFLDAGWKTGY